MSERNGDDGERALETATEAGDTNALSSSPLQTVVPPSTNAPDDDNVDKGPEEEAPTTVLLRMRGLPYGANEHDVEAFFENSIVAAYICRRAGRFLREKERDFFFSFFFFEAKALRKGRHFFFFFALTRFLSRSTLLSISLMSFSPSHTHTNKHTNKHTNTIRPPHGRGLRRVRHARGRLPRPRREAARLPRQPLRRALRRAGGRPGAGPGVGGQASPGRARQPRAQAEGPALHGDGGGRRGFPDREARKEGRRRRRKEEEEGEEKGGGGWR